jgi:ethanolamine ammonia-lyase large subunit
MNRYIIIVSIASGILFGVMDGLINANPLAQRLYEVYKPTRPEAL